MSRKPLTRPPKRGMEHDRALAKAIEIAALGWRPTFKVLTIRKTIPIEIRLRREGIRYFKETIHRQSKEWLIKNFGPGRVYPVNVSKLIKNIIWQIRTRILKGEHPPIEGKLRNFWYTHIKNTLFRADSLNPDVDQYPQMIKMFVRLIEYCDLMRYKDMEFVDDNEHDRHIGINNHVILFAEKGGHYPLLKRIAQDTEVTIIALGGQPSLLSAEYFVDEIKAHGIDVRKSFYTFSLVDYDTSGWIIRDAFLHDLKFFGLKHIKHKDLIQLEIFSKEEIELNKFALPDSPEMKKKNKKWLKESGGINGELYGLEADAAPPQRIRELFASGIKDLIESTEGIRKGRALRTVASALEQYILSLLSQGQSKRQS